MLNSLTMGLKRLINRHRRRQIYLNSMPPEDDGGNIAPLVTCKVSSYAEYRKYAASMAEEYARRKKIESGLAGNKTEFDVQGFCVVCQNPSLFRVDYQYGITGADGKVFPNWRERLSCHRCGMNNRMRASLHIFKDICHPAKEHDIYLTEQTTPVFDWINSKFSRVTGSEYLGKDIAFGKNNFLGIRNESLTALSFGKESFDYLLCFDVLEHIPEFEKAIGECFRVLKPGGRLILSVPFDLNSPANIVRARLTSRDEIQHLLPPEYHGDPINDKGCLCFYHFGWQLLDNIRSAGFSKAYALFYWSLDYGYLGGDQFIFMAQK